MKNKKLNEDLFEVMLESAVTDSFRREMDQLDKESQSYLHLQPTEAQKKSEWKAYKKAVRKKAGAAVVLRRAAVAVLILFSVGSVLMLSVPTVRAEVFGAISGFFKEYVLVKFSEPSEEIVLGRYTLTYLPKGYSLTDSKELSLQSTYTFTNGSDTFLIQHTKSSLTDIYFDNENSKVQTLEINGDSAYMVLPESEEDETVLIWGNEEVAFYLTGNLSSKEMIRVAKSIRKQS